MILFINESIKHILHWYDTVSYAFAILYSMEILRPQNINGSSQSLKGKIRITTRCLWLDKGKLLDALYKAAHAALSSCPVNCPLAHMERIVSEVLRKMVRKYSSKRPEVIAVAVENTVGVLSEELKTRLSGKSRGNQRSEDLRKVSSSQSDEATDATNIIEKLIEEDDEGESSFARKMPTTDSIATLDQEVSSVESTDSETVMESFEGPSVSQLLKVGHVSVLEEHLNLGENGNASSDESSDESIKPTESEAMSRKSAKRNKWKPEEIKRLIKKRAELDERFQAVKGRMILWEEVSASLMVHGVDRTPAQCKSLWASLVQKYEESRKNEKMRRSWPFFAAVDKIMSVREAT
ncbi:uncharacterized protein M6B38_116900 [Iris pallida]|uniref:Myb-like domain-containing protein n=1 Tax=Iris pallida TaxID=29817 RepID=A0AAX6HSS7_IRIPA|nr:uncharacterized protein M6B38_116900 [Iris pallida]